MRKLIFLISTFVTCLSFFWLMSPTSHIAYAACTPTDTKSAIECGASNTSGVPVSPNPDQSINDTIKSVINILSSAVGIAAVIMLVVGGFRYITAGGDSNKIAASKSTVFNALIGLVLV